jgi:hypothetical protein
MSDQDLPSLSTPGLTTLGRNAAGSRPTPALNFTPPMPMSGFVGLGRIGSAIAANLLRSRRRVVAYAPL